MNLVEQKRKKENAMHIKATNDKWGMNETDSWEEHNIWYRRVEGRITKIGLRQRL